MPTPIAHSLAAVTLQLVGGKRVARTEPLSLLAVIGIASLPDLDFLPGYLIGNPRAFHWGPAHSIISALLVGSVFGFMSMRRGGTFGGPFTMAAAVYLSHLFLDMSLGGGAPSGGLQVFWPLNRDRWMMPFSIFNLSPDLGESIGPVRTLFTRDILPVVGRELTILLPIVGAALTLRLSAASAIRKRGALQ